MKDTHIDIHDKLHHIYDKHRKRYSGNPDSKQMCCMWSTSNPPDIIDGTAPFCDIEDAFDILIDDENCLELYDMNMDEAVVKITDLMKQQR